uniref:Insulin-like peptide 1 n=1 Tax=Tritonia tetraquetra TaxID=2780533 RepID=I1SKI2_9GAST|nr:insulin-like peptide 1 precursor [Tritonia tetraquetra]
MVSVMLPVTVSPRQKLSHVFLVYTAVLFVCQVSKVSANLEHVCSPSHFENQQIGICGDRLATSVQFICQYAVSSARYLVKRSYPRDIDKEIHDIMLNKKDALSYLTKRSGYQGIVCECCINSCSVNELIQYCEPPSSRRIRSDYPK